MRKIASFILLFGLLSTLLITSLAEKTVAVCKFEGDRDNHKRGDEDIQGRIRFVQKDNEKDIDIAIRLQGLNKFRKYGIVLHENGNIKDKCKNIGPVFMRPQGYLATTTANADGEIEMNLKNINLRITGNKKESILNRSCAIHKPKDQSYETRYSVESADRSKDKIIDCARIE